MQPSLFESDEIPSPRRLSEVVRTDLGRGAWIDRVRGFMAAPTALLEALIADVDWKAESRPMYDRVVEVPRLVSFLDKGAEPPHEALGAARRALIEHYAAELPAGFSTIGLCYYRDGRDSVAFHGDRSGRNSDADTLVAICSLGATRRFLLRPRGGGASLAFSLASGDLLVMGGSCQRTFEHSVPKTSRRIGPRVSIQFRPDGVR